MTSELLNDIKHAAYEAKVEEMREIHPCTPGLPQANCTGCGLRVVAVTLNPWDQCVQCAKDKRTDDTGQMRLR